MTLSTLRKEIRRIPLPKQLDSVMVTQVVRILYVKEEDLYLFVCGGEVRDGVSFAGFVLGFRGDLTPALEFVAHEQGNIINAAYSDQEKHLVTCDKKGVVKTWTFEHLGSTLRIRGISMFSVCSFKENEKITLCCPQLKKFSDVGVLATTHGRAVVFDTRLSKVRQFFSFDNVVTAAVLCRERNELIFGFNDGNVSSFNVEESGTRFQVKETFRCHDSAIISMHILKGIPGIFSVSEDGLLRHWNPEKTSEFGRYQFLEKGENIGTVAAKICVGEFFDKQILLLHGSETIIVLEVLAFCNPVAEIERNLKTTLRTVWGKEKPVCYTKELQRENIPLHNHHVVIASNLGSIAVFDAVNGAKEFGFRISARKEVRKDGLDQSRVNAEISFYDWSGEHHLLGWTDGRFQLLDANAAIIAETVIATFSKISAAIFVDKVQDLIESRSSSQGNRPALPRLQRVQPEGYPYIVIGSEGGDVFTWSPFSARESKQLPGHSTKIILMAMSTAVNRFCTISSDGFVKFWNADDFSLASFTKVGSGSSSSACFLEGLGKAVIGGYDGSLFVTEKLDTLKECGGEAIHVKGHLKIVTCLQSSIQENDCFMSASLDHSVAFWTVHHGSIKCIRRLAFAGGIENACFTTICDEIMIQSGTSLSLVSVWDNRRGVPDNEPTFSNVEGETKEFINKKQERKNYPHHSTLYPIQMDILRAAFESFAVDKARSVVDIDSVLEIIRSLGWSGIEWSIVQSAMNKAQRTPLKGPFVSFERILDAAEALVQSNCSAFHIKPSLTPNSEELVIQNKETKERTLLKPHRDMCMARVVVKYNCMGERSIAEVRNMNELISCPVAKREVKRDETKTKTWRSREIASLQMPLRFDDIPSGIYTAMLETFGAQVKSLLSDDESSPTQILAQETTRSIVKEILRLRCSESEGNPQSRKKPFSLVLCDHFQRKFGRGPSFTKVNILRVTSFVISLKMYSREDAFSEVLWSLLHHDEETQTIGFLAKLNFALEAKISSENTINQAHFFEAALSVFVEFGIPEEVAEKILESEVHLSSLKESNVDLHCALKTSLSSFIMWKRHRLNFVEETLEQSSSEISKAGGIEEGSPFERINSAQIYRGAFQNHSNVVENESERMSIEETQAEITKPKPFNQQKEQRIHDIQEEHKNMKKDELTVHDFLSFENNILEDEEELQENNKVDDACSIEEESTIQILVPLPKAGDLGGEEHLIASKEIPVSDGETSKEPEQAILHKLDTQAEQVAEISFDGNVGMTVLYNNGVTTKSKNQHESLLEKLPKYSSSGQESIVFSEDSGGRKKEECELAQKMKGDNCSVQDDDEITESSESNSFSLNTILTNDSEATLPKSKEELCEEETPDLTRSEEPNVSSMEKMENAFSHVSNKAASRSLFGRVRRESQRLRTSGKNEKLATKSDTPVKEEAAETTKIKEAEVFTTKKEEAAPFKEEHLAQREEVQTSENVPLKDQEQAENDQQREIDDSELGNSGIAEKHRHEEESKEIEIEQSQKTETETPAGSCDGSFSRKRRASSSSIHARPAEVLFHETIPHQPAKGNNKEKTHPGAPKTDEENCEISIEDVANERLEKLIASKVQENSCLKVSKGAVFGEDINYEPIQLLRDLHSEEQWQPSQTFDQDEVVDDDLKEDQEITKGNLDFLYEDSNHYEVATQLSGIEGVRSREWGRFFADSADEFNLFSDVQQHPESILDKQIHELAERKRRLELLQDSLKRAKPSPSTNDIKVGMSVPGEISQGGEYRSFRFHLRKAADTLTICASCDGAEVDLFLSRTQSPTLRDHRWRTCAASPYRIVVHPGEKDFTPGEYFVSVYSFKSTKFWLMVDLQNNAYISEELDRFSILLQRFQIMNGNPRKPVLEDTLRPEATGALDYLFLDTKDGDEERQDFEESIVKIGRKYWNGGRLSSQTSSTRAESINQEETSEEDFEASCISQEGNKPEIPKSRKVKLLKSILPSPDRIAYDVRSFRTANKKKVDMDPFRRCEKAFKEFLCCQNLRMALENHGIQIYGELPIPNNIEGYLEFKEVFFKMEGLMLEKIMSRNITRSPDFAEPPNHIELGPASKCDIAHLRNPERSDEPIPNLASIFCKPEEEVSRASRIAKARSQGKIRKSDANCSSKNINKNS